MFRFTSGGWTERGVWHHSISNVPPTSTTVPFANLVHFPGRKTNLRLQFPYSRGGPIEEDLMAFRNGREGIDLEGVQPLRPLPVLKHRSRQAGFKQVTYNILVELRVITPITRCELP